MKELFLLLAADLDAQRIYALLEDREDGKGVEFMEHLEKCFDQLRRFPESGPRAYKIFRRLVVTKSTYAIFYVVHPKRIAVHAVLDVRQSRETLIRRLLK